MNKAGLISYMEDHDSFEYQDNIIEIINPENKNYELNPVYQTPRKFRVVVDNNYFIEESIEEAVNIFVEVLRSREYSFTNFKINISDILYNYPDEIQFIIKEYTSSVLYKPGIDLFAIINKIGKLNRKIINFSTNEDLFDDITEDGELDLNDFRADFKFSHILEGKICGVAIIF